MSRRTVALVAAVVLALIATLALFSYVNSARDENLEGASLVKVFVAKAIIPQGSSGDNAISQGLIDEDNRPKRTVPEGAITDLSQIKGRVASTNILASEVILTSRFVAPGQAGGGLPIPADRQAITVEVDVPPGVGNFVRQGDHVSLIGHAQIKSTAQGGARPRPINIGTVPLLEGAATKYIVQNVEVLAVGQRVVVTSEDGRQQESSQNVSNRITLTLAVTAVEAERIVFMIREGNLYFTLVPPKQGRQSTRGVTIFNEFPR